MTNVLRNRFPPRCAPPWAVACLRASVRSVCEICRVGARFAKIPHRTAIAKMKARAAKSTWICCTWGNRSADKAGSARTPSSDINMPTAPAAAARMKPSVSRRPIIQDRGAPMAPITANSRLRPTPLAKTKLATFEQTTNKTSRTAAKSISSAGRTRPPISSGSGRNTTP